MTNANDTNDSTDAQDDDYTRGDRFAVETDPAVAEVLVLDTMLLSGYKAVLLAEKDARTGEWSDTYPNKAQYLRDEENLDMVEELESLPEADVQGVENGLRTEQPGGVETAEAVESVPSLD